MSDPSIPVPALVIRERSAGSRIFRWILLLLLVASIGLNILLGAMLGGLASLSHGILGASGVHARVLRRGSSEEIAVIHIAGLVNGATVRQVQADVQFIRNHPNIRAVVLRVDSPGGGVTDADECYHQLMKLRNDSRVIVASIGSLGASGAYYISMAAEKIYAEPTSLIGSIGVMIPGFQLTGLMKKIGVQPEFLTSKAAVWKEAGSPFSDYSPQVKAYLVHLLDVDHARFAGIVSAGRGTRLTVPIAQVANGKVWSAPGALKKGLIDAIGYAGSAYHGAAKLAGIYHPTIVELQSPATLLDLVKVKSAVQSPQMRLTPGTLLNMLRPKMEYLFVP